MAKKRIRRSPEQLIADLQAKIEAVKRRAQAKKAKRSPALKHTIDALRAIDMALAGGPEPAQKKILAEAREPLAAYLQMEGIPMPKRRGRKPGTLAAKGSARKEGLREDAEALV